MLQRFRPKEARRFEGWQDYYHFIRCLERRGFERLGSGVYSRVYAKPGSSRVIKVSTEMDGWLQYICWAGERGYLGRQAPMVHSLKVIQGRGGGVFYVAVMERLACTIRRAHRVNYAAALREHGAVIRGERTLREDCEIREHSPEWADFVADFKDHFFGWQKDCHDENFMARFDGSLVLTDPIADPDSAGTTATPQRARYSAPARQIAA